MHLSETLLAIRNVLKKKNMGKLHIVFQMWFVYDFRYTGSS